MREARRATEFRRACRRLDISGIRSSRRQLLLLLLVPPRISLHPQCTMPSTTCGGAAEVRPSELPARALPPRTPHPPQGPPVASGGHRSTWLAPPLLLRSSSVPPPTASRRRDGGGTEEGRRKDGGTTAEGWGMARGKSDSRRSSGSGWGVPVRCGWNDQRTVCQSSFPALAVDFNQVLSGASPEPSPRPARG